MPRAIFYLLKGDYMFKLGDCVERWRSFFLALAISVFPVPPYV